jgi:hypothetical protein
MKKKSKDLNLKPTLNLVYTMDYDVDALYIHYSYYSDTRSVTNQKVSEIIKMMISPPIHMASNSYQNVRPKRGIFG